jgi:predicted RNA methylase
MKAREIPAEVSEIIASGTCDGPRYAMPQLERAEYEAVKKVLDAAGLKWNRKAKAHVTEDGSDASDVIDVLVETGMYHLPADYGAFDTPPALAKRLVEVAEVQPGMHVLEPSAGLGNVVYELVAARAQVSAVEIQQDRFAAELRLTPGVKYTNADFLELAKDPRPLFDRIVMNPPFGKRADIHHVNAALHWLKPGGRLVAIMSAGVSFRQDRLATEFRNLVRKHGGTIDPLPEGSFAEAGTDVNTVLVIIPVPLALAEAA